MRVVEDFTVRRDESESFDSGGGHENEVRRISMDRGRQTIGFRQGLIGDREASPSGFSEQVLPPGPPVAGELEAAALLKAGDFRE